MSYADYLIELELFQRLRYAPVPPLLEDPSAFALLAPDLDGDEWPAITVEPPVALSHQEIGDAVWVTEFERRAQ